MTDAEPQLNVRVLNSGSSSLKFGLYCVGPSRIARLISGEAKSIGDKSSNCRAEDSHGRELLAETKSNPEPTGSNHPHRKASRRRQNADAGPDRASNCPWRSKTPTALPH